VHERVRWSYRRRKCVRVECITDDDFWSRRQASLRPRPD
jgi:hypothetical protein